MKIIRNPEFVPVEDFLSGDESIVVKLTKGNASFAMMRRALGMDIMGVLWYNIGDNRIVQIVFEFEEEEDIERFEALRGEAEEIEVELKNTEDGVVLDVL